MTNEQHVSKHDKQPDQLFMYTVTDQTLYNHQEVIFHLTKCRLLFRMANHIGHKYKHCGCSQN